MSIVDELIVELKIDASQFTKGEKAANESLKGLEKDSKKTSITVKKSSDEIIKVQLSVADNAKKTADNLNTNGKKASGFFSKIRNEALMMLGVFTAGATLKSFVGDTVKAASSTGILASQIGISVTKLEAMEAAAQRVGVSSGAMSRQLEIDAKKASDVDAGQSVTQVYGSDFGRYGGDFENMKTAESQMLEYAKIYKRIKKEALNVDGDGAKMNDKEATAYASQQMKNVGLSSELIPLVVQGTDAIKSQIAAQMKKVAITEKDAKAAREATASLFDFTQQIDQISKRVVFALIPSLKELTIWLEGVVFPSSDEIEKTIDKWVGKLEELINAAKKGITYIDDFVESIGGWEFALKGLLALKVAGWVISLASLTAGLLGFSGAATGAGLAGKAAMLGIGGLLALSGVAGSAIGDFLYSYMSPDAKDATGGTIHEMGNIVSKKLKTAKNYLYKEFGGKEDDNTVVKGGGESDNKGHGANSTYKLRSQKGSMAAVIQSGESRRDGYNAYNRGSLSIDKKGGTKKQSITSLTIGQIQARQALKHGDKRRLFAVGRYQVITKTLSAAVKALGISKNSKFTPKLQDKIFSYLIKQRKPMINYITGKSNNKKRAVYSGSQEWASITNPETGLSYYAGKGGNKAHISEKKMGNSLELAKKMYSENIGKGMNKEKALNLALLGLSAQTKKKEAPKPIATIKEPAKKVTIEDKKGTKPLSGTEKQKSFKIVTKKVDGKLVNMPLPEKMPKALTNNNNNNAKTVTVNNDITIKSTEPKAVANEVRTTLTEKATASQISGM